MKRLVWGMVGWMIGWMGVHHAAADVVAKILSEHGAKERIERSEGLLMRKGDRIRIEMTAAGLATVTLIWGTERKFRLILPQEKIYVEEDLWEKPYWLGFSGQWGRGITAKRVGEEEVSGFACTVFESRWRLQDGSAYKGTFWLAKDLNGLALQARSQWGDGNWQKMQLEVIGQEEIAAALFEVPPDALRITRDNLQIMRKGHLDFEKGS